MSAAVQAESAEEWRPVPGFPGYQVSDTGRLLSDRRGRLRFLRQSLDGRGYQKVVLYREGLRATRTVHSLVALAFIGSRPAGLQIRHLDGNRNNNRAWNLKYGTAVENMQDRFRHGTNPEVNKTECPRSHPYSDENTYITPAGTRRCRACQRERARASYGIRAAQPATQERPEPGTPGEVASTQLRTHPTALGGDR